jgi:predicted metal-binding membrane protein
MTTPELAIPRHGQRSSTTPILAAAAALTATVAVGWVVLAQRMSGMDMGPGGDPGTFGWFAITWSVMTVAMMLPAAAPAVVRLVQARPAERTTATGLFLAGYVGVWLLAGLAGFAAIVGVRDIHIGALGWSSAGRYVAGGAIVAAGLYQLTAVKARWLARCASPQEALRRPGARGALIAGAEHGMSCVACCWALMAALYALGIMSLAWMALLTVAIAAERIAPRPTVALRLVAVLFVILGIAVAASPGNVPALTIPTNTAPAGMHMGAMN